MKSSLHIYNTLSRKKEKFEPINNPHVGLYVCGPTVYGDAHLGHARAYVSFDIIYRYLLSLGYKVRYVRNITDVGHLEDDEAETGEDKIQKKAKLEKIEPMEVVQFYTNRFHEDMDILNTLKPSIEPQATGHILEQIEMIEKILSKGLAYEVNGSVYFDVAAYHKQTSEYGILSGRNIEELLATTRTLQGQEEKRNTIDFALWKKAAPEHIMRWKSPWSDGFPGWHLECSVMSTKYLGEFYDIHGGGMDLLFPHHECEIAQCHASNDTGHAKYWMHNNMITINGQKMGKRYKNFINLRQLFLGDHHLLKKSYSPMTVRFFILQAHYRSTLDFSNEALEAASKGYSKLINALKNLKQIDTEGMSDTQIDLDINKEFYQKIDDAYTGLNDDYNTALCISHLFKLIKRINALSTGQLEKIEVNKEAFSYMKTHFIKISEDILGVVEDKKLDTYKTIEGWLDIYKNAKEAKKYDYVDKIRGILKDQGIIIKDMKEKIDWSYEE